MEEQIKDTQNQGAEKTFTQSELDQIIGERLRREREKYADYDELKGKAEKYDQSVETGKTEMQKANEAIENLKTQLSGYMKAEEIRKVREKVASDTKVPYSLLTAETEEDCKKQAEAILAFAKPKEYPAAKKNTVHHTQGNDNDEAMREFAHQIFGKGE